MVALIRRDLPQVAVLPVVVSEGAQGPDAGKYINLRSQLWWEVGRALTKDQAWDLSEVDDRTLADLAAPRW